MWAYECEHGCECEHGGRCECGHVCGCECGCECEHVCGCMSVSVGVGVCGRGRGSGWRALCLVMRGRQSWREASVCSVGGGHRVQRGAPGCDADKLVLHS